MSGLVAVIGAKGSRLDSWQPLTVLLVVYAAIVVLCFARGRDGDHPSMLGRRLQRVPNALEALTGIPGWAAAMVGTSLFGLLVAGIGFYNDVAWHIALGRDKALFTPPHSAILVGLFLILFSSVVGVTAATLGRLDTRLRFAGLRVPWSTVPMGVLGLAAVSGFPLDDIWHAQYGIDVTMWSPTHMLMILGAAFTGLASWLVLGEAGVRPDSSRWARTAHILAAIMTLQGLIASQGEFSFGVPQFQQMYHPVLVCLAAGMALVLGRIVLGRGWMLGVVVATAALQATRLVDVGGGGPVHARPGGLYVVSAVVVEVVAAVLGTGRRLRFALVSGLGVGTIGLAGEWVWNAHANQPWRASLLPGALVLGVLAAVGAAILGATFARAVVGGRPVAGGAVALGALAALTSLVVPLPRTTSAVTADIRIERTGATAGFVHATLDPPDAADHARWFQASTWQGGSLVLADMRRDSAGGWVSERPVPIAGPGKTVLRLHRGSDMIAVAIHMPADPEIGKGEIVAADGVRPFVNEQRYLLRESHGGSAWFSTLVYVVLAGVALLWGAAFGLTGRRLASQRDGGRGPRRLEPAPA